jgi:predicted nucleic acid-binding protein
LIYLDTSILLVFTLTRSSERGRSPAVDRLFNQISSGAISASTSFYALHELYVFALENVSDPETGYGFGKAALDRILRTPLRILPFSPRTERRRLARRFVALRDASDIPHAVSAYLAGCEAIVAYDEHFRTISHIIPYKTPEDFE